MDLQSPRSTFTVGTSSYTTGALCTVSAGGSIIFSKVLHPSPSGNITLNLPKILSSAITSATSVAYTVTYNGSQIDSGTFEYHL